MKLNDEELTNKFSALDFDPQNIKQNRIYSKLNFEKSDRRYVMKKFIYALGTVCLVGLLLIPILNRGKVMKNQIPPDDMWASSEPAFMKNLDGSNSEAEALSDQTKDALSTVAIRPAPTVRKSLVRKSMASPRMHADMAAGRAGYAGGSFGTATSANFSGGSVWRYSSGPSFDYNSMNDESYKSFEGNAFKFVKQEPLSTFSADVDTASYNIVRRDIERGLNPSFDAVRTEEFINYFSYDYPAPKASSKDPVNIITELTDSPWNEGFKVVKIGVKAKEIEKEKLPPSNLVFLIDVSGSMYSQNRLPLVKKAYAMLVKELRPNDKVSIVTYADGSKVVLNGVSLEEKDGKQKILDAMEGLTAGGGTYGSGGLDLAYKTAKENFIKGGNNRVILATDGDFNLGQTSLEGLEKQITQAKETGVFLSVLGFGMGNYKDDKVQTLANKGNGNYAYINDLFEAKKALVKDFGSTLFTVAKDVKFQVEFNPAKVQAYRLIGYEKRKLQDRDFNDDTKDAGELGAGHTVTVLYEIIPVGTKVPEGMPTIDELKYSEKQTAKTVNSDELLTVKLRYKEPDGDTSKLMSKVLKQDAYVPFAKATDDTRFALSVAAFAELVKKSRYSKNTDIKKLLENARKAKGEDADGYRADFIKLVSLYEAVPQPAAK